MNSMPTASRSRRGPTRALGCWYRPHLEWLEDRIVFAGQALALPLTPLQTAHAAGFLRTGNDISVYSLHVQAGDQIHAAVSAQTAGTGLVSLLRVFDATGRPLALDDQEGGDPRLTFQAATTGDYYLGVSSAPNDDYDPFVVGSGTRGRTTGTYTLNVRDTPGATPQADLAGSSFRLGTDMAAWGETVPVRFSLENRGARAADSSAAVQVVLADKDTIDSAAHLYSFPQSYFSVAGLGPGQSYSSGSISVTLPDRATAAAQGFPSSGPVYLGVRIADAPAQDGNSLDKGGVHRGEDWERLTIVTPLASGGNHARATITTLGDLNGRVSGSLEEGDDSDSYGVDITDPGQLTVQIAADSTLVFRLALYSNTRKVLLQTNGGPADAPAVAELTQHLTSGSYFLVISPLAGEGDYTLTTRFLPASPPLQPLTTGSKPVAVAVADLNGDGVPDLVAANNNSNTVGVFLGNGDGSFARQTVFGTDTNPDHILATDLNSDGRPDLVSANFGSGTVSVLLGNGNGTFQPCRNFAVGAKPAFVAAGDVNGDGVIDLVTANYADNSVSVLLGDGDGTFQGQQTYSVGTAPNSIAVADVNGDGSPDIVVANRKDDTVSVLLGDGDGTFQGQQTVPAGANPRTVVVADLNGDGRPDLAVSDVSGAGLSVFLGKGDGSFLPQSTVPVGTYPDALATADINGDGRPDLIAANFSDDTISVLLGLGDGTFHGQEVTRVGSGPIGLGLADLDGDGRPDLVVAQEMANTLGVLLGNGDGSFQNLVRQPPGVGSSPRTLAVADINRDGKPDLIVGNRLDNTIGVLLGNGDGSFQKQTTVRVGSHPRAVAVADVNGDGRPDLTVANYRDNTVSVVLGNGDGSFTSPQVFAVGKGPIAVAVADLDKDGHADIIVSNHVDNTVGVLLGNGDGSFRSGQTVATGARPYSVAAADINGDGNPDLAVDNYSDSTVSLLVGQGDGTFRSQQTVAVGSQPVFTTLADVNGDGRADLVAANFGDDTVSVLLNKGDGAFSGQETFPVGAEPYSAAVADINGDGRPDLVVANFGDDTVSVLSGDGSGSFPTQQVFKVGSGPFAVAAADVNVDGRPDVLVADEKDSGVSVLLGSPSGLTLQSQFVSLFPGVNSVVIADLRGDGRRDLVTADYNTNTISVLLGNTDGSFGQPLSFAVGSEPNAVAVADVNGDGHPDIVTANHGDDTVSILLGDGDGGFAPQRTSLTGTGPYALVVVDVNGDGKLDVVTANEDAGTVSVLLSGGDGTFVATPDIRVGSSPQAVAVADINGDGRLDLAVANLDDDTVTVLLGDGQGGFPVQNTYDVGTGPDGLVLADVSGDGKPDLAVANYSDNTVTVLLGDGQGGFPEQNTYDVGRGPNAIAVLQEDGHADLVTANALDKSVTLLRGDGHGHFQKSGPPLPVGSGPHAVAVATGNGDGKPELLVTANYGDDSLSILTGDGHGSFGKAVPKDLRPKPRGTAVADLNGDGKMDLVSADYNTGDVTVLLGRGDGSFRNGLHFPVGKGPKSVATADVNGDGRPDLLVANYGDNTISVLLGDGAGSFTRGGTYPVGANPIAVATTDINGDDKADLIVANRSSDTVSILLGNGDGSFQTPPVTIPVGSQPNAVAVADVDGDGHPDIVAADYGANTVTVRLNNGSGSFPAGASYPVGSKPISVAMKDINGDGRPDLIVANYGHDTAGTVSVLLGDGDGSFQTQATFPVGPGPKAVTVADFNDDGRPDIATVNHGDGSVSLLLGNGDGSFSALPETVSAGSGPKSVTTADFNGDGRPDLAVANYNDNTISVLLALGSGALTVADSASSGQPRNTPLLADLNHDGRPDSVILDRAGNILVRAGQSGAVGQFDTPLPAVNAREFDPATGTQEEITARDLAVVRTRSGSAIATADAIADPVLSSTKHQLLYTVSLYTYSHNSFLRRGGRPAFTTALLPTRIVAGDLNGDGLDDLVVADSLNDSVQVAFQARDGTFGPPLTLPVGLAPSDIVLTDVNGDGLKDIVVSNQAGGTVTLLLNDNSHSFATSATYRSGTSLSDVAQGAAGASLGAPAESVSLAAGRLSGGRDNDLVVVNRGAHSWTLLRNQGGGFADLQVAATISTSAGLAINDQPGPVAVADFDHDGRQDVAVLMEDTNQIWVYRNRGAGTFAAPIINSAGIFATPTGFSYVPGFRGGADRFLVGNAYGDVLTLLGDGTGRFAVDRGGLNHVPLAVGRTADGRTFALVADQRHDQLLTYVLRPDLARFDTPAQVDSRDLPLLAPGAVQLADLHGDHGSSPPDLIVASQLGNAVLVYPGLADGGFGAPTRYAVGAAPVAIAVADLNGDGVPDLAVADRGSDDVTILFGSVDPQTNLWSASPGPRLSSGGRGPTEVTVSDSGNARGPDLLVTNSDGKVALLPGIGSADRGTGFFQDNNPQFISIPGGAAESTGDTFLNPDGEVFRLDPLTRTPALIFDPAGGPAPILLAPAIFEGRDALAAINSDGTLGLIAERTDGTWAQMLVIDDARLDHPSAIVALGDELFVTNAGQAQPLVFGLSQGVRVPVFEPPEPHHPPLLRAVAESDVALVPVVTAGLAPQVESLGLLEQPAVVNAVGQTLTAAVASTDGEVDGASPATSVQPAGQYPPSLGDLLSGLGALEERVREKLRRDQAAENNPPPPEEVRHQNPHYLLRSFVFADIDSTASRRMGTTPFHLLIGSYADMATATESPTHLPNWPEGSWHTTGSAHRWLEAVFSAYDDTKQWDAELGDAIAALQLPAAEQASWAATNLQPGDSKSACALSEIHPNGDLGLLAMAVLLVHYWVEKGIVAPVRLPNHITSKTLQTIELRERRSNSPCE